MCSARSVRVTVKEFEGETVQGARAARPELSVVWHVDRLGSFLSFSLSSGVRLA